MQRQSKFRHYDNINDFLTITPDEVNQPVYYQDDNMFKPPMWFAVENFRIDIISNLLEKQKQAKKTNVSLDSTLLGLVNYAQFLANDALKKREFNVFLNHLKTITAIDESDKFKGITLELIQNLDKVLANLNPNDLKQVIKNLLNYIKTISDPKLLHILNQSKYINYLLTAFDANTVKATHEFNPDHLRALNRVGFNYALNKKSKDGDRLARYFIKQALELNKHLPPGTKPQILFSQGLYLDSLEEAVKLINAKNNTKLKVYTSGACSAFVKFWINNEEIERTGAPQQANFFNGLMQIASLTEQDIAHKVENESSFVRTIKSNTKSLKAVHFNDQFEGQFTQRTMKKQFGFEYIDHYDIGKLKLDTPIYAYLQIRYNDEKGHAIAIHIQQKTSASGKNVLIYKVWDPNDDPKTFTSLAEFNKYLNGFRTNPTITELNIHEFATYYQPTTKFKITAINEFLKEISTLPDPGYPYERSILNTIKLLEEHYQNGVIALNDVIPLFVFLSNILNNSGQNINLNILNQIITGESLASPDKLDLNRQRFMPHLIQSALDNDQPQIATVLFSLGLSLENSYHRQSAADQDVILEQAIKENRTQMVNDILQRLSLYPNSFPISLALEEMMKHSHNVECKNILARVLLAGKNFTADDYAKLEKKPETTSMFTQIKHPYKENLKKIILQQVLQEIKKNRGKLLGKENTEFLSMLDNALNPVHVQKHGCYDILTYTYFGDKNISPQQQIVDALQHYNITVNSSMQNQFPFLFDNLTPSTSVIVPTT